MQYEYERLLKQLQNNDLSEFPNLGQLMATLANRLNLVQHSKWQAVTSIVLLTKKSFEERRNLILEALANEPVLQ